MLTAADYQNALMPNSQVEGDPTPEAPRYTKTKDPNVTIGRYGIKITRDDMNYANKHGMAWGDNFDEFSNWLGGWAHKMPNFKEVSPYYRTYPSGKIDGGDIALLMSRNDPSIDKILQRNIAKEGEVPMFGPDDSDALRAIIDKGKNTPTDADYIALAKSKAK